MMGASNAVSESMDFDAGFANIEQQTQAQATRLEVIDALRVVCAFQRLHGFQFNDHGALNQHVSELLPDDDVVVPDRDCMLLCHAETCPYATCGPMRQPLTESSRQRPVEQAMLDVIPRR
jgi:hypothetical protein